MNSRQIIKEVKKAEIDDKPGADKVA